MRFATLILICLATGSFAQTTSPNHLLGAQSPYLLQHLYNPVDWYPWGPLALDKAKRENKLIFLSVGYASCHWCHVMEAESFENQDIADFLNQHFVAIKVDRERRPDLDEQFQLVTQSVTGGGGWPNTVFLTPDAAPFYGGTYYPPQVFTTVLQNVVNVWQEDPQAVQAEGQKLVSLLSSYMTETAMAANLTPQVIHDAAVSVLADIDVFHGGLGTAPKFPQELLFLFLLDQAHRRGDGDLLAAVTGMLDGMIGGGIHDHVGGGFHRYATDPEWRIPHFEKMLYTQAMTGRLLVRAWATTGDLRYKRAFERLADYVLRDLRDPDGGFYSAQDADSKTALEGLQEGAFFTWTPADMAALGDMAPLLVDTFGVSDTGDIDGASILHMSALPNDLAQARGLDEQAFYAQLDPALDQLRRLRQGRPEPATDKKILMAWNAAMIATLAEAAHVLDRPDLFEAARKSAQFLLSTLKTDTGYHRVSFQGRSGVAAQLSDYAGLGLALVALHDFAPQGQDRDVWRDQAFDLAQTIRQQFGAPETGFRMTQEMDGFTAQVPVDDGELPSGNAMTLALFARLSDRMQAPGLETSAHSLLAAMSGHAVQSPRYRGSLLLAADEFTNGATGPVQYAGAGAVRVEFEHDRAANRLDVRLSIRDGWHINAPQPLEDYLVPTSLSVDARVVDAGQFPQPLVKTFGFSDTPLAVLEGDLTLQAALPSSTQPRFAILHLQPCSDEICLQPQALRFTLW